MLNKIKWLANSAYTAVKSKKIDRQKSVVLDEYSVGWNLYRDYLNSSDKLDDWLRVKGLEDEPHYCNLAGKMEFSDFDMLNFNRRKILETIQREFPEAKSVTEYGSGLGRNLLYLKKNMPFIKFYGYELCQPGVELAQSAANKFGLSIDYSQLDYVEDEEKKYVFPKTDVAFTMYSLEQLPHTNKAAVENILRHTKFGSIHIEPVPENYPITFRGLIGKLDHWKINYLSNFEKNINSLNLDEIKREFIGYSHNSLMFPTLYVLKKKTLY
jgi:hypothetical protein